MLTLEQAKALERGTVLYHAVNRNADGTPQRWRVSGKVKRWKRNVDRIQIPLKYGLHGYDYLTGHDLDIVCLSEEEAMEDIK